MSMHEQKSRLSDLQTELKQRIEKISQDLSHRQTSQKFSEQVVERHNDDVLYNLKAEAEAELAQIEKALLKLERNLNGKGLLHCPLPNFARIVQTDTQGALPIPHLKLEQSETPQKSILFTVLRFSLSCCEYQHNDA